jgi:hypothetical protein
MIKILQWKVSEDGTHTFKLANTDETLVVLLEGIENLDFDPETEAEMLEEMFEEACVLAQDGEEGYKLLKS